MDTKNFILAIALSILAFVIYQYFFAPNPSKETVPAAKPEIAQPEKPQVRKATVQGETLNILTVAKGKEITVETDLVNAVISTAGGVITKWELKDYQEADKTQVGLTALYKKIMGQERKEIRPKKELGNVNLLPTQEELSLGAIESKNIVSPLAITPLEKSLYKLAMVDFKTNYDNLKLSKDNPSANLTLTYKGPAGISIEKTLKFYNNDYKVDVLVKTHGLDGYNMNLGTDFGLADKISSDASGRVGIVEEVDGKFNTLKVENIKGETQSSGIINWFGQEDKYFTASIIYGERGIITSKRMTAPAEFGDLLSTELTVKEKVEERNFTLYAGPKSFSMLAAHGHGLEQMVDYGWFSIVAKPMFWLLRFFFDITKNYGIAIILLTIVVRILLFYPSLKSALSMEEMKKLQPQIVELKEKYKKDPKRMNQETMKLYKEHKVNPLGGCLPMLLQLPFFIALYNVLSVSIELRQAPFISFWIKDLSIYDPYYILPVLMGVSMILMMKMTSSTADPQQAKIMLYMNIAFIFLFAWLPAGLLLYITLSNVLSIAQQMYVHKLISSKTA